MPPEKPNNLDQGCKIGRYILQREIGRGGMAVVYLAFDPHFERQVAIKVMPRELLIDPSFLARFKREAKIIASLEHPAIVPVYDYGEARRQPYLVMRYMPGGSLEERLKGGRLSPEEVCRLFERLAPALDEAHAHGIVHRDLKPGNILFDQRSEPYLSDFGIVKLTEATTTLTLGGIIGTPAYMSPEQGRGEKDLDRRADIYSLGAILFHLLTGRLPYEADTPTGQIIRHLNDPIPDILSARIDLPPAIQTVINHSMAKKRDDRYATVSEMAHALKEASCGQFGPETEPAEAIAPELESIPESPILETDLSSLEGEGVVKKPIKTTPGRTSQEVFETDLSYLEESGKIGGWKAKVVTSNPSSEKAGKSEKGLVAVGLETDSTSGMGKKRHLFARWANISFCPR